jgi:hypothetical protein
VTSAEAEGGTHFGRLLNRLRRTPSSPDPGPSAPGDVTEQIRGLESRVEHLEQLIEGLQDSVHRELTRSRNAIRRLEQRTDPAELARALDQYRREHGV